MFHSIHTTHFQTTFVDPDEIQEVKRLPLPISDEYDMIRENYFSKEDVDRSHWVAQLLENHPEIKELREKVLPLDRAIEFGRLYLPDERLVPHDVLLSLISQHLRTLGLIESQSSLHSEWEGPIDVPTSLNKSQLNFLIQRGVLHAERFWELTMPGTQPADPEKLLTDEISKIIGDTPATQDAGKTFEEERVDQNSVVDLKTATPNQIIWICTTDSQYFTEEIMHSFCLHYTSYFNANVFFDKIKERFHIAFNESGDKIKRSVALTSKLVAAWMEECGSELEDRLLVAIKNFAESELRPKFPKDADIVVNSLHTTKPEEQIDYSHCPKVELNGTAQSLWACEFDIMNLPPKEFARQLTIHFAKYFYNVKRSEFLDMAWELPQLQHKAPNLVRINNDMNNLTFWCVFKILEKPKPGHDRVEVANYFYKVAKKLYDMQDYQNCGMLLNVFEQHHVHRLKTLLSQVDNKLQRWAAPVRDTILSNDMNMRLPIELSEKARATGKPCLPYLTAYLKRLGNFSASNSVKKGVVDTTIITQVYQHILNIQAFQAKKYCYLPIDQAQDFLDDIPIVDKANFDTLFDQIDPK